MALCIRKVLISDKVDKCCQNYFESHGISVDYKPGLSKEELLSEIKDYDALIVRSATKVTADVLEKAINLKIVGRAGTGVDNIDLESATKKGVLVMNTPGGNTISAAEHTCALISALSRHVGQGHASLQNGKWERSKFMGCELLGKTLAIIGLGRIGKEVAFRMQSFGMKTIGYDPIVPKEEAEALNIRFMSLEEIWPLADFITVHVPLIPPTKGMINKMVFSKCKPDVRVINVARGGIIDESDLLDALNSGTCGGAALDVFASEPPQGVGLDLTKHEKVLATPHLGASTKEAQTRVALEIAQQIVDATQGKPIFGLVNAPALSQLSSAPLKPWVNAAQKLGKLAARLAKHNEPIKFHMNGIVLKNAVSLLQSAFCCGFSTDANVNMINAVKVLKETGNQITPHYADTPQASISFLQGESTYAEVTLAGGKAVLTRINKVDLTTPVSLNAACIYIETSQNGLGIKSVLASIENGHVTSISSGKNSEGSLVVVAFNDSVEGQVPSNGIYVKL